MKRLALVALALVGALAAVHSVSAKRGGVLAIIGVESKARLGYVDPATLKLVGRSTQVGYYQRPSVRSPDGTKLALARDYLSDGLRIIDLKRMRTVKAFKLAAGAPSGLAWVAPRKIVAASNGVAVVAVDPVAGRELWRRPVQYDVVARSAGGLVLLSSPDDYEHPIGPTTLTTVSAEGVVRTVVLDRILTGAREPDETNPAGAQRRAGLAVDVAGDRVVVVGAGEPIAEVDLGTLAVTYHGGTRTLSKLLDGPSRDATWLPNGTIAVTGYDGHVSREAGEGETPAGLVILDPKNWSGRVVDPNATSVAVSGDLLVAYSWVSSSGFSVYGLDGSPRLRALDGWSVQNLQIGGSTAFATVSLGNALQFAVVDLTSARVLSMRPLSRVNILLVP
jgi:hypothetical protein